ncbi:DMT family transporter [Lutibacter sp. A64]|uniref:DMT family transporter n=1 Tax=Lutibacter sp. A64 TaxID=2918526 RepID=UPI001F05EB15|nr:DMT family transporter [Lutibacter sp. A64]UMB52984.1 DMT family transporter [Lutibacter sp. A64]
MKKQQLKNIFDLNIAVILMSTSGVLGKSILFPPEITIWWRCLFTAFIIGLFCWYKKYNLKIKSKKDAVSLLLSGFLLGGHWVTYFYALHLSNVAIGMLSLFTYPIITTLLEPLFFKTKLSKYQLVLGAIIIVGIYFLTPEMNFDNNDTKGVLMGILSACFYAVRNIITKRNVHHYNASIVMLYQLIVVVLILWPFSITYNYVDTSNWIKIASLALITTALGHTLFVNSFKNFTISTASIMGSMSPIYGIILGVIFLSEIPSTTTLFGGALILATVFIESIKSTKK